MNGFTWGAFWKWLDAFYNGFWHPVLNAVLIIVIAIIARTVLLLVIRRVTSRIVSGAKKKQNIEDTAVLLASPLSAVRVVQRTRTLGSVLSNIVTAVIVTVVVLLLVDNFVPNATGAFALITAALGAGLGFGAQNVVKDVLNGLFIVSEDQLGVGDVVDLGVASGVVELVNVRVTIVRDVNGTLWHVRNGEILRVGNMSQGWARVIIDLAVPYDADVEAVQVQILATATDMATSSAWRSRILEKPEIWGIESISAEAVVVRLVMKTRSAAKDDVARELRARIKRTLDEAGIRLPALNSISLNGVTAPRQVKVRPAGPADLVAAADESDGKSKR